MNHNRQSTKIDEDIIDLKSKPKEPQVSSEIEEKIEKFNRLEEKLDNIQKDFITILGIFASFFTFISVQFQILRVVSNPWILVGLSSFLASSLLLFALVLRSFTTSRIKWRDFLKPEMVLILLFFIFSILCFIIYYNDP